MHGIFIIRISNQGSFKNLWRGKELEKMNKQKLASLIPLTSLFPFILALRFYFFFFLKPTLLCLRNVQFQEVK